MATVIAMVTMLAGLARAGQKVEVVVEGAELVPFAVLQRAELLGSQILRGADVDVRWMGAGTRGGTARRIAIQLEMKTPATTQPGALAYATPYEGTRIVVFFGRIQEMQDPNLTAPLLAHVMVHEITHLLRGDNHHTSSGVMKAHWDSGDYLQMKRRALALAPEDIEMIQAAKK